MQTNLSIRNLSKNDVDQLVEIENEIYKVPWTKAGFDIAFTKHGRFYVLENNNEIIGYIGWLDLGKELDIAKVSIKKSMQGKGHSQALMEHLIDVAGDRKIMLEVRESNTSAIKLYEKWQFKKDGIRPKYYDGEDAILFSR